MKNRVIAILAFILAIAQVLLILMSWVLSAAIPELPIRSLLGSEGIRWFFRTFTDNLQSPLMIWILLASIAWGALKNSGMWNYIIGERNEVYRQRFAFRVALFELLFFLLIIGILILPSHAILLSVTGYLFPSSFSQSIIPSLCFILCTMSVSYGYLSGSLSSLTDISYSLTIGISHTKFLWLIYILGMEFYSSIRFVLIM